MLYREDVLIKVYTCNDVSGYIIGIEFRLSNLKASVVKQAKCDYDIITLIKS